MQKSQQNWAKYGAEGILACHEVFYMDEFGTFFSPPTSYRLGKFSCCPRKDYRPERSDYSCGVGQPVAES
jgi:hypothetical protein